MSFFGGGRPTAPTTPSTTTSIVREAPGIEERKIELMDIARQIADQPIDLPALQVAQLSDLEKQGITAAGTTGVGSGAVQEGIATIKAIGAGAFGGGREGVQQAELQGRTLSNIGRSLAQGFQTALGGAQRQQQIGLLAGQQLGALGAQQQRMSQADLQQLMAAGGLQRQLAQATLDAQRQTELQQLYEPYQRAEFLANLYAQGPKTQSGVTMGTTPSTSPFAQAVGTGIGAFAAYQGAKQNTTT